jgi:uncharacterized membrane protein
MSAEFLALFTALAYASANVAARWGLRYSTPNTATLISLFLHATLLLAAVSLAGGVPDVPRFAFYLVIVTGVLQMLLRFFHYTAIARVGVSRAVTLRNTYPMLSVLIGITVLGEQVNSVNLLGVLLIVMGTGLTSWRMDEHVPSFRAWFLVFPVATAVLTAAVHPMRRFAMTIADEPLFFAAVVGTVSFASFLGYLALPVKREKISWQRRAIVPFVLSGIFETVAILLLFYAFASGPVVVVSPIAATSPIWTVILTGVILRDVERINTSMVFGTLFVVSGAICVALARYG